MGRLFSLSCDRGVVGTPKYAPLASHAGADQCPWDDAESLVYTGIALHRKGRDDTPMAKQPSASLCAGLPAALEQLVDECRGTTDLESTAHLASRFQRSVDYELVRRLLRQAKRAAPSNEGSKGSPSSVVGTNFDTLP